MTTLYLLRVRVYLTTWQLQANTRSIVRPHTENRYAQPKDHMGLGAGRSPGEPRDMINGFLFFFLVSSESPLHPEVLLTSYNSNSVT